MLQYLNQVRVKGVFTLDEVSYNTIGDILIECLKVLGYVDNQLYDIIDFSKNLRHVIPEDLADKLPIQNKKNSGCYQMIKELLC